MVRWGLIGASTISKEWVIGAIRATPGNEVVALFSRDRARGERFAAETGIGAVYDQLDAMLAAPDVDAVYIASTNDRHHDEVLACAAAGKHVLCEKPLALSVDQGLAMVAACERAGVVFAVNHHLRGGAQHRAMHDIVASGELGRIVAMRVAHGGLLPAHLHTWRINDPSTGAGAVLDLAVHDVDLVRFLLADEVADVVSRTASTGLGSADIEDTAMSVLRTRSGVLVELQDMFNTPFNRTGVEVHGTQGSLFATDSMTQLAQGALIRRDAGGERWVELTHQNLYERVIRQFDDAVAGRGAPGCTGRDGVASLAVALAALESARTGQVVAVDARATAT